MFRINQFSETSIQFIQSGDSLLKMYALFLLIQASGMCHALLNKTQKLGSFRQGNVKLFTRIDESFMYKVRVLITKIVGIYQALYKNRGVYERIK